MDESGVRGKKSSEYVIHTEFKNVSKRIARGMEVMDIIS